MMSNLVKFAIYFAVIFSAIMFAYAGWLFLSNDGKKDGIKKALNIFKRTLFGTIAVLIAWLLVNAIMTKLAVNLGVSDWRTMDGCLADSTAVDTPDTSTPYVNQYDDIIPTDIFSQEAEQINTDSPIMPGNDNLFGDNNTDQNGSGAGGYLNNNNTSNTTNNTSNGNNGAISNRVAVSGGSATNSTGRHGVTNGNPVSNQVARILFPRYKRSTLRKPPITIDKQCSLNNTGTCLRGLRKNTIVGVLTMIDDCHNHYGLGKCHFLITGGTEKDIHKEFIDRECGHSKGCSIDYSTKPNSDSRVSFDTFLKKSGFFKSIGRQSGSNRWQHKATGAVCIRGSSFWDCNY
jgi:hypothetical protein